MTMIFIIIQFQDEAALYKKAQLWLVCTANLTSFSIKSEAVLKFIIAIQCETTFHYSLQEEVRYAEKEYVAFG